MSKTSKEIYESWPEWKRNVQIGKLGAEDNPAVKVIKINQALLPKE